MRNNKTVKKILVINTKYLGDLIVCTPALRALKKSFSNSSVSILVRQEYKEVLTGNPNVDEIIPFDFSTKKIRGLERLKLEWQFVRYLRRQKFDAVISLQSGDRYAQWSFLTGAKIRVAPKKQNMSFLLTEKVEVYEDTISYLNYYLKIAEAFGAVADGQQTEFHLDENFRNRFETFRSEHNFSNDNRIVGIHAGASEPTKIWPLENFENLIEKLLTDHKAKIVLFVGPAEKKIAERFSQIQNSRIIIADTSGSIQQLAWLINSCRLFIANDSGARHIAAALNVPSITLFPDDKISCWKFYEELSNQHFIIGKRNMSNPANMFLDSIDVDTVYEKVKEIISK
ncbi:MAG: glycosyltransferase family 9 protein [Bacteroidota bacterium]